MKIISFKHRRILFAFMVSTIVIFAVSCSKKTIQVENALQLKEVVLANLLKKLNPKDTLFIVTSRLIGVCGNDERFNAINQEREKLKQFNLFPGNTYVVNEDEDYMKKYNVNGKTIITGAGFDDEFSSPIITFNNDSLKTKKLVYDLKFIDVEKDTLTAYAFDFLDSKQRIITLKMALSNHVWTNASHN